MDPSHTPPTDPAGASSWAEPPTLTQQLGRYQIRGVLGRGGMGEVYSGYDPQLRRRVAIKRLRRSGPDAAAQLRLAREAQALARLAHPNIVTVHETFEHDDRLYLVMELVEGPTLREWLKDARPSQDEILAALIQAGRGITAAHAAGLVHRDLKPDNIMLDDDGRVRVMDFGLARALDEPELVRDTLPENANPLTIPLTRSDALLGTPGYIAPEVLLGREADARADVFGFCVVAFEALYGERPFLGRDEAAVRAATLDGRLAKGKRRGVPEGIDAVIRRGLAVMPSARWPSMDALLAALEHHSTGARGPRRTGLSLALLVVLAIGAVVLGLRLEEARERARLEDAAAERLLAMEDAVAAAEARGDHAAAEAAFEGFVGDPAHHGTRALTRAWLGRGDRRRAAAPALAQAAYAEAYVRADTTDDELAALDRLTAVFHDTRDGAALGRVVELIRAKGRDELQLSELAFDAALWERDLPGALAELERPDHSRAAWRPLLEHLGRVREGPPIDWLVPSDDATHFVARDRDGNHSMLLDGGLREVGRWSHDGTVYLVRGMPWVLVQDDHLARLVDLESGALLGQGTPTISTSLALDVTGDRAPELLFGRTWPAYGFQRWDDLGRAGMHESLANPETDASDSTLDAFAVGDLDGDGADEIALGFGPWHRFDVRLLRPDATGELQLVAQRRLGRAGSLAFVQRGSRRLLAAFVDDCCASPELFPVPPHTGEPPGVYLLEWVGDELEVVEVVELPRPAGRGRMRGYDRKVAGDLDGDGLEDLAFAATIDDQKRLLLLRQTDAGFVPLQLGGLDLMAGAQLDDDAPLELLVRAADDPEIVALGLGDAPLRPMPSVLVDQPPAPGALVDELLVERWDRANELVTLDLVESAANSLRDAAALAHDRESRSVLLDRAGELFASQELDEEVLGLDDDVHVDPPVIARVRLRRAQALSNLGRFEAALAEAQGLLTEPGATPAQLELARSLTQDLAPLLDPERQLVLRFEAPLDPAWELLVPGAVQRDPTRGILQLALPATPEPVAALPIEWDGSPISIELDATVERLEFGACFRIALLDARDVPWLGGGVCGQGGGGRLQEALFFKIGAEPEWLFSDERDIPSGHHRRPLRLRATYFPTRGSVEVASVDGDLAWSHRFIVNAPPAPGPQRLVISSFAFTAVDPSLAQIELHEVRMRGARLGASSEAERSLTRPGRLLAEHEPRAALDALAGISAPFPQAELLRLLAHAELGELEQLRAAALAMVPHVEDREWWGELAIAIRRFPVAAAALHDAAGPQLLPALASIWAHAHPHRNDAPLRGEILQALQDIEHLEPQTSAQREALRTLLRARADLWEHGGEPQRASADLRAADSFPEP